MESLHSWGSERRSTRHSWIIILSCSMLASWFHYYVAWTLTDVVLMQRNDLAGSDANFFGKSFYEFQVGFGDPSSQYWIGLENLYSLTHSYTCTLRFDLQNRDDMVWHWAEYSTFYVGHVSTKYVLTVGGVTADFPGDCMANHTGMPFTTYDNDNDNSPTDNCANKNLFKGGFWHNNCFQAGINEWSRDYFYFYYLLNVIELRLKCY